MFNLRNIKKTVMPSSTEDGLTKFAVAGGLVFTVYIWNQYTTPALKYISNNVNHLIQSSGGYLPESMKQYFTTSSLVGVTLASQIFITSKTNHPPVIDFTKNTVLGFGYYIPFTIVSEVTKSLLFSKTDNLYSWACHSFAGLVVGGFTGSFIEDYTTKSLDKAAQGLNTAYYSSMLLATMITGSLFGKTKAKELDNIDTDTLKEVDINHEIQEYTIDKTGLCSEGEALV